jgi:hypothetical protein
MHQRKLLRSFRDKRRIQNVADEPRGKEHHERKLQSEIGNSDLSAYIVKVVKGWSRSETEQASQLLNFFIENIGRIGDECVKSLDRPACTGVHG